MTKTTAEEWRKADQQGAGSRRWRDMWDGSINRKGKSIREEEWAKSEITKGFSTHPRRFKGSR